MPLEVEQKFPILDPDALLAALANLGVVLGPAIRQVDTYYQHPARDFRQTDEALRIRQVGEENCVTYKGPKLDALTKTRRELELPIAVGETGAREFKELLTALGFQVAGQVVKHRRTTTYMFTNQIVEMAWDEIADLGCFLELEIVTDDSQLAVARDAILALARQLPLGLPERRSYLELVFKKRGVG